MIKKKKKLWGYMCNFPPSVSKWLNYISNWWNYTTSTRCSCTCPNKGDDVVEMSEEISWWDFSQGILIMLFETINSLANKNVG